MDQTETTDGVANSDAETKIEAAEERWSRLEKVVRGMGRDSLTVARGQQETQSALAAISARIDDLDLAIKGVSQTAWRAAQERLGQAQEIEKHFAGALRELEKRIREELLWQIQRNALLAIFPALDDMARVVSLQRELVVAKGNEDPFLEAMELVHHKAIEGLRAFGMEEISVEVGVTRFDPALHEAKELGETAAVSDNESVASGTIIGVGRTGYKIQDRVFRAPQVFVKP